ncbi:MAG: hypothetical protein R3F11_04185 [Verrucomicrobiales bacterium]
MVKEIPLPVHAKCSACVSLPILDHPLQAPSAIHLNRKNSMKMVGHQENYFWVPTALFPIDSNRIKKLIWKFAYRQLRDMTMTAIHCNEKLRKGSHPVRRNVGFSARPAVRAGIG